MPYSEAVLARASARLAQARQEQREAYEARLHDAYNRYPRLREIDRELRATTAQAAAAAFRRGEDPTAAIKALRDRNLTLQQEREWILEAAELDPELLEDTPICAKCGGSGYLGAEMCECLRELCRAEQKKELSSLIGSGKERFSAFRLDVYSTAADHNGISPREVMTDTLDRCRKYAAGFSLRSPSLLFTGNPGLGKTFLSACIARTVSERGFSVVYETVVQAISDFEAVKFGTGETRDSLRKYAECDLLILDDLGTELVTQFSLSALYTILNSRVISGLPTVVSTNLSPNSIRERYSPAIASRLLGLYELVTFLGDDFRLRGKL